MDCFINGSLISNVFKDVHQSVQNEFQIQALVLKGPNVKSILRTFLHTEKSDTSDKSTEKSEHHREIGNRLFRANKKQNALAASRSYTNAIITAPNGSRALALAYANRSASISELGYYKEAYEDCLCAIENGYPDENMEKIIIRQAFCASKLDDCHKLNACLEKLKMMTLSKPFEKQKAEFEEDLSRLSRSKSFKAETVSRDGYVRQKISRSSEKGRYLTTTKDTSKGEVVLIEKAFAFVPVDDLKICNNCASQHIIPFPCDVCSKVFYCSLKCKKEQAAVHKFECYAFRCKFLPNIGIIYPAMNILLNGLPSIIDELRNYKTGEEIWERIEQMSHTDDGGYTEILSLVTNFKTTQLTKPDEFHSHCTSGALFTLYLKEFTSFFDLFKDTNCKQNVWIVVTSALLLRHILQMICNTSTSLILYPLDDDVEFQCLSDVWVKARHLRKGRLHTFSYVRAIYAGMFPHLSVCNHSCDPSFRLKYDGNCVVAYSRQNLKQGSEIFNSYLPDFKKLPKSVRKPELKEMYRFDCNCKYCTDDYRDDGYLQFFRYRCQNPKCKAVFVPQIEKQDWWMQEDEQLPFLTCPTCKVNLNLDWYWRYADLTIPTDLTVMLDVIKFSEKILVGYSELRCYLCLNVAQMLFASWKEGAEFSNSEFIAVGDAIKYMLEVIEQKNDVRSVIYVAKATYALDLMALGKYFNFDYKKIQQSMDMLSTEMRSAFDNYIDDYIGERFYVAEGN